MNNDTPPEITWTGLCPLYEWILRHHEQRFFRAAQRGPEKDRKFKEDEGKWRDE